MTWQVALDLLMALAIPVAAGWLAAAAALNFLGSFLAVRWSLSQ